MRFKFWLPLVLVLAGVARPASAQARPQQASVLLAVSEQPLPRGVRALVVRTAGGAQDDLIVLAPDANAQHTLPGAVALLKKLRADAPTARTTEVHYVELSVAERKVPPATAARFSAQLARARNGVQREIDGVGNAHVVLTTVAEF